MCKSCGMVEVRLEERSQVHRRIAPAKPCASDPSRGGFHQGEVGELRGAVDPPTWVGSCGGCKPSRAAVQRSLDCFSVESVPEPGFFRATSEKAPTEAPPGPRRNGGSCVVTRLYQNPVTGTRTARSASSATEDPSSVLVPVEEGARLGIASAPWGRRHRTWHANHLGPLLADTADWAAKPWRSAAYRLRDTRAIGPSTSLGARTIRPGNRGTSLPPSWPSPGSSPSRKAVPMPTCSWGCVL